MTNKLRDLFSGFLVPEGHTKHVINNPHVTNDTVWCRKPVTFSLQFHLRNHVLVQYQYETRIHRICEYHLNSKLA
jgi:hypothetical protein